MEPPQNFFWGGIAERSSILTPEILPPTISKGGGGGAVHVHMAQPPPPPPSPFRLPEMPECFAGPFCRNVVIL